MSTGPDAERDPDGDRRRVGEQRRYNRRAPVTALSPPYFEVFERVAAALEGIENVLQDGAAGRQQPRRAGSARGPSAP